MIAVLIREGRLRHKDTQRADSHVNVEAEMKVVQLQAKEYDRLLRVIRSWEEEGRILP